MKKVLILSPYFPPLGGSGVFRLHRWAKYLPEFGIQPIVVHYDQLPGEPWDESLLHELPESVLRYPVRYLEPSGRGIRAWRRKAQSGFSAVDSGASSGLRKLNQLIGKIRDRLLIPDLSVSWIPFVVPVLRKIIREHRPEALITTYSPGVSNLLGLWLKCNYHLPWIADFRDPWTDSERRTRPIFPLSRLERCLERQTLSWADFITAYSDGLANLLRQKIPEGKRDKFITLGPAVDTAKFDRIPPAKESFDLFYAGAMDRDYPCEIFSALSVSNQERVREGGSILRVGIAGKIDPAFMPFFQRFQSEGWLTLLGYRSHQETISLIKSARALLLLHPAKDWWVPGKVAEYLYSGKPVLAIVAEGELKEILQRFDRIIFAPNDHRKLGEAILGVFALKESSRSLPREFTARGQAEIIAGLFENLLELC